MSNEEFVSSIVTRIEQLKIRAKMEWYSKQSLEEALEVLKDAICNYTLERPQYEEQMRNQLEKIEEVKRELL
ncbi:MAG: hypothetical protein AB9856_01455 [Cellulosilyticaceae bacterium]